MCRADACMWRKGYGRGCGVSFLCQNGVARLLERYRPVGGKVPVERRVGVGINKLQVGTVFSPVPACNERRIFLCRWIYNPKAYCPMLSYTTLAMLSTTMPSVQMASPMRV